MRHVAPGGPDSQVDMAKLMMKSSLPGNMPPGFAMNADSVRSIVREVDFWTEDENSRLMNAIAMDASKDALGPDWDVICE